MNDNSIRLEQSECPYTPSPKVLEAINNATLKVNRYPKMFGGSLPEALAIYTDVPKEQIIVGNGSDDLIELIIKILVRPQEQVLVPIPTFPWYWYAAKNLEREVIFVNRNNDFGLNIQTLLQKVTSKVKVIFISNPNNPTGNLTSRNTLIELIKQAECLVVVDECYYEFCQQTVADLVNQYPNLIVLRSFSKGFALAGLRVGYALTNIGLALRLRNSTQFFGVNTLAQTAAIATLNNLDYYQAQIEKIHFHRTKLSQGLENLGFNVYPSSTNFLFVGTKKLCITSSRVEKNLQEKNIYIKNCGALPGLDDFYFRTSVSDDRDNQALLNGLAEVKGSIHF